MKKLSDEEGIRHHKTAIANATWWNNKFQDERTMKEIEASKRRHPSRIKETDGTQY